MLKYILIVLRYFFNQTKNVEWKIDANKSQIIIIYIITLWRNRMSRPALLILFIIQFFVFGSVWAQKPIMHWDFENNENRKSLEIVTGVSDTLEGNFEVVEGIEGKGIRLDGFTTCLRKEAKNVKWPDGEFSIEAWVAVGNYPWNWCPILTTESKGVQGYRLMLGPLGQVSLQVAIDEQWVSCSSAQEVIPLRKWMHIVGVYRAQKEMELYINGKQINSLPLRLPHSNFGLKKPDY